MSDWLRRNRWFLIALVVLIPAAFAVSLMPRFFPYLENQPRVEYVERGDTVGYAGSEFEVFDMFVIEGEDVDAPPGTDVFVVGITVEVVEPSDEYCTLTLISDETGVEREWDQSYGDIGDVQVPDGYETSCDLTERNRYDLVQTFLVPRDEVAEPVVQITTLSEDPRVVRLR